MTPEPVSPIDAFGVRVGENEALEGWEHSRDFLATQEGYLSTRLHRRLSPEPDADVRFLDVALRQPEQAFHPATRRPELRDASVRFPSHASLYELVREDER